MKDNFSVTEHQTHCNRLEKVNAEKTLVEACSGSDVQIDRKSWVYIGRSKIFTT